MVNEILTWPLCAATERQTKQAKTQANTNKPRRNKPRPVNQDPANNQDQEDNHVTGSNLDLGRTILCNLCNYDSSSQKLLVDRLYFYAAERKLAPVCDRGSRSVGIDARLGNLLSGDGVHFCGIAIGSTSLYLFDTDVPAVLQPQGGPAGGCAAVDQSWRRTNITLRPATWGNELVREPARSIVVLITDFYEGAP